MSKGGSGAAAVQGLVELRVRVPATVLALLRDAAALAGSTAEQFIENEIAELGDNLVDELPSFFFDHKRVREKYKLPKDC